MTVFEEDLSQQQMARLSGEMVRLYKEQFGRGPTRVRSHFAGPEGTVVVVLEETFTARRAQPRRDGRAPSVCADVRLFFQYAPTEEQLCGSRRGDSSAAACGPSSAASTRARRRLGRGLRARAARDLAAPDERVDLDAAEEDDGGGVQVGDQDDDGRQAAEDRVVVGDLAQVDAEAQ